jgi:hypothetical protein
LEELGNLTVSIFSDVGMEGPFSLEEMAALDKNLCVIRGRWMVKIETIFEFLYD